MEKKIAVIGTLAGSLLLVGCGGGGSSSVKPTVSLDTWSGSIAPNTIVTASGISTDTTYTAPSPTFAITALGATSTVDNSSSASITYNGSGNIESISLTNDNGTVSWGSGDTFAGSGGVIQVVSADSSQYGIAIDPVVVGWDYQTFGAWITGMGSGSGRVGAISVGNATAGSSIPTTGTATFTGYAGGFYSDGTGAAYLVTANSTLNTDFSTRQAVFSTSGSNTVNLSTAATAANSGLNLSGTLTYSPATNSLTTSSLSSSNGMSGTANAQFYGTTAQEVGGVFSVRGAGTQGYIGSFGASR